MDNMFRESPVSLTVKLCHIGQAHSVVAHNCFDLHRDRTDKSIPPLSASVLYLSLYYINQSNNCEGQLLDTTYQNGHGQFITWSSGLDSQASQADLTPPNWCSRSRRCYPKESGSLMDCVWCTSGLQVKQAGELTCGSGLSSSILRFLSVIACTVLESLYIYLKNCPN